jgi:hypothetical protein
MMSNPNAFAQLMKQPNALGAFARNAEAFTVLGRNPAFNALAINPAFAASLQSQAFAQAMSAGAFGAQAR